MGIANKPVSAIGFAVTRLVVGRWHLLLRHDLLFGTAIATAETTPVNVYVTIHTPSYGTSQNTKHGHKLSIPYVNGGTLFFELVPNINVHTDNHALCVFGYQ